MNDALQRALAQANIAISSKPVAIRKEPASPYTSVEAGKTTQFSQSQHSLDNFFTVDPDMIKLKEKVQMVSSYNHTVLIVGETGTGKELLARALHGNQVGQFVAVNCGGFPENIVDSILFGHVKGSFTGATDDKLGLVRLANNGTLFLDEIGELPTFMQSKLLRVMETRKVRPVGSTDEFTVNCKFVGATNRDPKLALREDLYWRFAKIVFHTKPLRERHCDLELILKAIGWRNEVLDVEAIKKLELKGNVRELESILIKARFGL